MAQRLNNNNINQKQKPQNRPQQLKPRSKQQIMPKITAVQIEGLVLLKIIQNCGQYLAQQQAVSGKLLGIPMSSRVVEVTNCFPTPSNFSEIDETNENEKKRAQQKANKYCQKMLELMSRTREDNNIIGWYRSALNGSFVSSSTIDAQYKHQLQNAQSICIIYDPTASNKGRLVVRAVRLTDSFMKFYAKKNFGPSSISNDNLKSTQIFEELDVKIHNTHLVHAFLYEINQLPPNKSFSMGYDRLHHSHHVPLMSNMRQLSHAIDSYAEQTQQFRSFYGKSYRKKQNKEAFIAKFKEDNQELRSRGQKPRPMPDVKKLFPKEQEPERMESVTLSAQMSEYCDEIETNVMQGLVKLWVTQGIHSDDVIQ